MKKYRFLLLFLISFFLIQSSTVSKNDFEEDEGIWSGTVSFIEKQTGKEIVISEWKMEAKITSNKGKAIHSFHSKVLNGAVSDCKTEDETELGVDIDYEINKYSIEVPMPGCYGQTISEGRNTDFAQTDATAITIDNQTLKDPNVLEGTIAEKNGGGNNEVTTTTTYTWKLVRINKRNKPLQQNASKPKPASIQPYNKERWTGTVTWYKTSRSKARVESETVTSHWDDFFIFHINVQFVNGKGVVYRADTTTKWRLDSIDFVKKRGREMVEEKNTTIYCKEKEDMDLEVLYSDDRKHYWVSFFTPTCPEYLTHDVKNNIHGNTHSQSVNDHLGIQINMPATFTGELVGNNPNVLTGTWKEIVPAPNDPGGGTIITGGTWNLKKVK